MKDRGFSWDWPVVLTARRHAKQMPVNSPLRWFFCIWMTNEHLQTKQSTQSFLGNSKTAFATGGLCKWFYGIDNFI
jgi:hypothetical protein